MLEPQTVHLLFFCMCVSAGFGSTDENPKMCSTCPLNSYNEGPLPRAQQTALGMLSASLKAANDGVTQSNSTRTDVSGHAMQEEGTHSSAHSAKHQPDTPAKLARLLLKTSKHHKQHHNDSTRTLTRSSWRSKGQQNSRQPASGFRLWRGSSNSSNVWSSQPETTGSGRHTVIQERQSSDPAQVAAKHEEAADKAAPSAEYSAAAVRTAQLHPQQFIDSWGFLRNSGVNPVFYEPTYSPCTQCGPACYTNSPGSTSVKDCSKSLACRQLAGLLDARWS